MNSKVAVILIGVLSCVLADYVPKKKCVQRCTSDWECGSGYICKSIGCNSQCQVLPVDPVNPILSVDPVGQVDPRWSVGPVGHVDPRWSVDPVGQINPRWSDGLLSPVKPIIPPGLSGRRVNTVLPVGGRSVIPRVSGLGCHECVSAMDCRGPAVCRTNSNGCRRCTNLVDSILPKGCVSQCASNFDCLPDERRVGQIGGRCRSCVDNKFVGQKY